MPPRPANPLLWIIAAAAVLYLLGNAAMPLWDRDEPRYAECSREMLQSGDWVVPRYLGGLRTHKPPLIYWCQAAAMSVLGPTGAAARFPSALAVTVTAALLAWFVRHNADQDHAIFAVLVFCTCPLTIAAAKLALTDAMLLLFICIGQGCLYCLWRNTRHSLPIALLFWISTALAGLTKGPVVLLMHAATLALLAILDRKDSPSLAWLRRLRPLPGLLILVALVTPWLAMVNARAPDFLPAMLNRAGKYASSGAEGHAHWPGFYLLLIWGLMFPWSVLLPASLARAWRNRSQPLTRFALAAAVGPWFVMELVPNKLPFYILPSFPALAILTAQTIVQNKHQRFACIMATSVAAIAVVLFAAVLPFIPSLSASRAIGQDLTRLGAGGSTPVAMIDYREPSLAFYQGGGARESDVTALSSSSPPAWAVLTTDAWSHLDPATQSRYQTLIDPLPVLIYNDGPPRVTHLLILRAR
jgi:4-amino-4-deoxy-L-arabinose transferase-like glycosyltransferase